jgi:RNA polymerase sigma-70 factor (ECF subfamily)
VAEVQDEIIMQRVRDGNLEQMSVLFERYHVRMYNFFVKMTSDREASHDLTQNLFYRIMKYRDSYSHGFTFRSWIYQMARNLYMDMYNAEKRSRELFLNTGTFPDNPDNDGDIYSEEDYLRLEKSLQMLSREQREIIVLSRYQGLKYAEISAITSLSVPAIKVAVYRAVKQLRGIYFKQV